MTRAEKIKDLQTKIETIKVVWQPLNEQLKKYEMDLRSAEKSFDVGEKVIYKEANCKRGCCGSTNYTCVVEGLTDHGAYNLRDEDGTLHAYISDMDISRVL